MRAMNHLEWREVMKGLQSQSREKIQEKISEIKRTVPWPGGLGRGEEGRLYFNRCLLTRCGAGASCGLLRNFFHHRSLAVGKNKVENGWHKIVSMIYQFNLVTTNQRKPFKKATAKAKKYI